VTVVEAASILGVTPDAVRSRLRRGTLRKETGEDGTVYVRLDGDGRADRATGQTTDRATVAYIDALRSENELLRRELDAWQEESRRKDHIIMNMSEAMKALAPPEQETPRPQEPRDAPEPSPGDAEGTGRAEPRPADTGAQEAAERPWWRRFLGLE
jgi:hypothetical protein